MKVESQLILHGSDKYLEFWIQTPRGPLWLDHAPVNSVSDRDVQILRDTYKNAYEERLRALVDPKDEAIRALLRWAEQQIDRRIMGWTSNEEVAMLVKARQALRTSSSGT